MFRRTSRAQSARSDTAPRYATVIVLGVALLSGCASTVEEPDSAGPVAASPDQTEEVAPTEGAEASSYDLCAEFPMHMPTSGHGDLEGWWSSTPVDLEDGSVIEDPADWPEPKMAQHPRTAVIDVESGEVLSTWDRTTCTDDPDFVPVPNEQWPAVTDDKREFVVVDMDTNEVVNTTLASEF
ncbi:hypothetical protein [Cellulomonas endometrii]|uniref:hypothetical protein n=1 Tax=Cellulomonas endometrii TaxID=3036301 RepID=UPI0024AD60BA|nr:hypothetical protein [Cellulomonas endometrii]